MPFLQAVFCLKGFDDRSRFFATSMITLLSFIILSTIFFNAFSINFVVLVILTTVLTCSTKRRLHDAKLTENWQLVPGGLFLLTGVLSLLIENSSSHYLLILPFLSTALLLTYPSKSKKPKSAYIWGYYGPVDLSMYVDSPTTEKSHNQRIEPTLAAKGNSAKLSINEGMNDNIGEQNITLNYQSDAEDKSQTHYHSSHQPDFDSDYNNDRKQIDVGELIRLKFLSNRKFQIGIIVTVSVIFISVFINSVFNGIDKPDETSNNTEVSGQQTQVEKTSATVAINRNHLLNMPDNFNLYLSEYDGVIIQWSADNAANGELWSLTSATGDESCQKISFNKGSSIRPLAVSVENGSEYFASFSPLDSSELIQALAFRGKFTLCGYSFSLKGTQAVLGKHNQYAPFLETDR